MAMELDAALADCGKWSVVRVSRDQTGRREHFLQPDLDGAPVSVTGPPPRQRPGRPAPAAPSAGSGLFDWQESS